MVAKSHGLGGEIIKFKNKLGSIKFIFLSGRFLRRLEPKEGYGELNPDLRKAIPRDMLPKDQEPKEGMILMMQAPNGQQFPAKITKVDEKTITIDLNHPLAGKKLMFKIKMEDIDSGDKGIESKV